MLFPGIECLSIRQYRSFMRTAVGLVLWRAGLGSEAKRAKWATEVKGEGWSGVWIPFQDQLSSDKGKVNGLSAKPFNPKDVPVGKGCDVVVLAIHGGGYIDGNALMFMSCFKNWMKSAQEHQSVRIGVLSIEYGLSPENPYPYAMDEIIAAFRDLVKLHGVDPKQIVLLGDSAGGNICLGTSLKLRDSFSDLGAPAGQILICPWVRDPEPLESSMFDIVSAIGCEIYSEAYTQLRPEIAMCPYTSPCSGPSVSGLPPMLVFIGGVEILRPSLERFVKRVQGEGGEVRAIIAEGRSHNYFLLDDISTKQDREEAYREMSEFALKVHQQFTKSK
ncbi:hypothetical protein BGZ58_005742 [Dissophora ornata]|nr:hypothetical protein BGZ58_005742 [Dissophora ornata]